MLLAFRRGWLPNQSRGYLRPLPQTGKPSCDGSTAEFRVVDLISHHDVRILMLSNVLKSKRATQVNIEIMRAFVRLRQMLRLTSSFPDDLMNSIANTTANSKSCLTHFAKS